MQHQRLASCLVLVATLALASADEGKTTPVKWERDLNAARKLARQTGKPLMVSFRCER